MQIETPPALSATSDNREWDLLSHWLANLREKISKLVPALEPAPILKGSDDNRAWNALNGWLSILHSQIGKAFTPSFYSSTKKAAATLLRSELGIVFVDTSAGIFTLNLPPAVQCGPGSWYWFFKTDVSGNALTIDANGAETINGALTYTINAQYKGALLVTNGTAWFVLATI